jgi:hypothetical protein
MSSNWIQIQATSQSKSSVQTDGWNLNTRDVTIKTLTASKAATSGKTLIGLDVMMNVSSLNDVPSDSVVDETGIVVGAVSVVVVVSIGRDVGI